MSENGGSEDPPPANSRLGHYERAPGRWLDIER